MPTLFVVGPYRFYFTSHDRGEPPYVHVEKDGNIAKYWLLPIELENSGGFNKRELKDVEKILQQRVEECKERWNEFFGS